MIVCPDIKTGTSRKINGKILIAFFFRFFTSRREYSTGNTINVSGVAVISPPITTVASGRCTSAPAEVEIAIGKNPSAAAEAVSNTGRILLVVPTTIISWIACIPCDFSSLKYSMRTIPLSTAIPNKAIKPTPAEILKGISLIYNNKTPPTADKGIALYMIIASLNESKAKYSIKKIRTNAIGTAIISLFIALCRFSNWPPYSIR